MQITCSNLFFSASHFIVFENGFCEPLHGHNFGVEAIIDAPLNKAGYVIDFLLVNQTLSEILSSWREKTLLPGKSPFLTLQTNGTQTEISCTQPDGTPLFWSIPSAHCFILDIPNTTAELIAQTIGEQLWNRLIEHSTINELQLRVTETVGSSAIWTKKKYRK